MRSTSMYTRSSSWVEADEIEARDAEDFRANLEPLGEGQDPDSAHVIRYISSLAIPYSAPRELFGFLGRYSATNARLSMSLLTVVDSQTINVDLAVKLKAALIEVAGSEKTKSINDLFAMNWHPGDPFFVTIHAEAALMGASYSHKTVDPSLHVSRRQMIVCQCLCVLTADTNLSGVQNPHWCL